MTSTSTSQSCSTSASSFSSTPAQRARRPGGKAINVTTYTSEWTIKYKEMPEHSFAARIMAYATGAPQEATIVKKKTRRCAEGASDEAMESAEHDSRLFWITLIPRHRRRGGWSTRKQPAARGRTAQRRDGHHATPAVDIGHDGSGIPMAPMRAQQEGMSGPEGAPAAAMFPDGVAAQPGGTK
ncbi:hypothetical protein DCS_06854 [Drechmeria coniospora]|uniref:Uncharacterized protein n=1 Tax=Drechmeria coniospora TaxID=98403 RepID=A0A151GCV3_DRECN|nr:hypothetical protein DCS_06854 [Drechmeria coniospora]KYK54893.1 hypothetical protein DCS_06854 [Drechmeria coniospora]ODA75874.1 hypothetical protein RJ55_08515 [Drechmeria coniospora]